MRVRSVALLVCVCVAGCARLPVFRPSGEPQTHQDANRICQSLANRAEPVRSARALVYATVRSGSEAVSLRYAVVTKEPNKMRIDLLPLEGAYTLGLLVVGADGATVIDTTNRTFSADKNAEKLTREFVGLPGLTPEAVLALLTGRLPPLSCSAPQVFKGNDGVMMIRDGASRIVWEVDQDSAAIIGAQMLHPSGENIEAQAEIRVGDGGLPLVLFSVYSPAAATAEMVVRKLTLNREIPDDLFKVAVPAGYSRN